MEAPTTKAEVIAAMSGISQAQRPHFFALLGRNLTTSARTAYLPDVPVDGPKLLAFNEILRVVMSRLVDELKPTPHRWEERDFLQLLFHWARIGDCEGDLGWALNATLTSPHWFGDASMSASGGDHGIAVTETG